MSNELNINCEICFDNRHEVKQDKYGYYVTCYTCGERTRSKKTKEQAIIAYKNKMKFTRKTSGWG